MAWFSYRFTWSDAELAARLVLAWWMIYLLMKMENPGEPVAYVRYKDAFISVLVVTVLTSVMNIQNTHNVAVSRREVYDVFGRTLFPSIIYVNMQLLHNEISITVIPKSGVEGVTIEAVSVFEGATHISTPLTSKWLEYEIMGRGYMIQKGIESEPGVYSARFDGGSSLLSQAAIRKHFRTRGYKLQVFYRIKGIESGYAREFPIEFPE